MRILDPFSDETPGMIRGIPNSFTQTNPGPSPVLLKDVVATYPLTLAAGEIDGIVLNADTTESVGSNLVTDSGFDAVTEGAVINSGTFTVGNCYKINTQTDADFTTVGAPDSVVGTYFNATATGAGVLDAGDTVLPITFTNWASDFGWAPEATAGILTGRMKHTAGLAGSAYQAGVGIVGEDFKICSVVTRDAGTLIILAGDSQSPHTTSGTYIDNTSFTGSATLIFYGSADFEGTIDNVTVRQVTNPKQNGITTELHRDSERLVTYKTVAGTTTVLDDSSVDPYGSGIITGTDSDFSGANNWANFNVNSFDATTGGHLTATATAANQYFRLWQALSATEIGKKYILEFIASEVVGGWYVRDISSVQSFQSVVADVVYSYEFTAETTGGLRFVSATTTSSIVLDDVTLREVPEKTLIALRDADDNLNVFFDGSSVLSNEDVSSVPLNKRHYVTTGEGSGAFSVERLRLGAEIATGTCTISLLYYITATEADHFAAGLVVGDYFISDGTETLDANNKVRQVNP